MGGTAGCTTSEVDAEPVAAASSPPAEKQFGPAGWGRMPGVSEQDAPATGELQTAPISTMLDQHVYGRGQRCGGGRRSARTLPGDGSPVVAIRMPLR